MRRRSVTIDELLAAARARLERVPPEQALDAVRRGAILVDIRSERQRARDGTIPGAIFCPRNVLEWRVGPNPARGEPDLGCELDTHLILICDEGYQSSLAAATLHDLGLERATDLEGGFRAWRDAGLPVERPG